MKLRYKIANGFLIVLALAIVSLAVVLGHTSACGPAPAVSDGSELMKAVVYRCYGPPEVLVLEEIEKPTPGDGEVLVKVHAASVNPLDWHYMRGAPYIMRLSSGLGAPDSISMGADYAGVVEAVGKDVTRFKPGDEVFGARSGAFGEYVTVGENRAIVMKPANVSFEQAAAVPVAAITALQALRDKGQVKPGHKVLINGASGGVGTYAVQIAKSFGAEVTGVCSTRNVEMVKSIGADHVIDYTKDDYTEGGQLYDVIIDNVGNHSLLANTRVLTPDGVIVLVGGGGEGDWIGPLIRPLTALLLSPFVDQELANILAQLRQDDLVILAGLMESGQMKSVIDSRFGLDEVPEAIGHSEEGHARGKIIVTVE